MRRRTSLPKPAARVRLVHLDHVAARNAQPVAHAVIAREIGRGLGRRHDVIGRQRVFGHAAAKYRPCSAPASLSHCAPAATALSISAAMPGIRYSFGMPMRMPLTEAADGLFVVGHRQIGAGRILRSHGRPSSAAGWRSRARCARTVRPDRARRQRRRCPSASSGRRSASTRRCRRMPPAGGSSRRYRCRWRRRTARPRPPRPSRPTSRRAPALHPSRCRRHGETTGPK